MLEYGFAVKAAISLVGVYTLHIFVLREAVLGSLSPLADASFLIDLSVDLTGALILALFTGRLFYVLLFSGWIDDHISVASRLTALLAKAYARKYGNITADAIGYAVYGAIERRRTFIEIVISAFAFVVYYIGASITIKSVLVILMFSLFWATVVVNFIWFYKIALRELVDIKSLVAQPKKLGAVVSILVATIFMSTIFLAHGRARQIYGTNTAVILDGAGQKYCVSLLGKSSSGIFFAEYYSEEKLQRFLPFDQIKEIYTIGGGELIWMPKTAVGDCGDHI